MLLSGCDQIPDDMRDIVEQVLEAAAEEAANPGNDADGDPEFEEGMREAREDWGTHPASPDIPPIDEGLEFTTVDSSGQESASEQAIYQSSAAPELERHYTEQYGSEPTRTDDHSVKWTSEQSETTLRTNADDTVTVESTWKKP